MRQKQSTKPDNAQNMGHKGVKERPILFSSPMVTAILDGSKTQTRRIIKPQPPEMPKADCHPQHQAMHPAPYLDVYCSGKHTEKNPRGMGQEWLWWQVDDRACDPRFKCPFGVQGDLLWVREKWAPVADALSECTGPDDIYFAATAGEAEYALTTWRPSIHMPRWASRILLEITDIRIERLQDISKADVIAEGITERDGQPIEDVAAGWHEPYAQLWESIHGVDSWESNPFIWAISFRDISEER
jgi:hypothetical protein